VVDGSTTGYRQIRIFLRRGSDRIILYAYIAPGMVVSGNYQYITITLPLKLQVGDILAINGQQNSGSSLRFAASINFRGVTHNET
jgi:hypothetical protein